MTDWSRPPVPPELDRLEAFAGEWVSEDEHAPTPWAPEGGPGRSRHVLRRALDGYCFVSDFEGETPFGAIRGHAFWFWDRERSRYGIRWYDSFANLLEGDGAFRDDGALAVTYRYRMAGADVDERHLLEPLGPHAYRLTIENVVDGVWRVASVQRYRKAAATDRDG
jgi:hypothetical protein